MNIFKSTNFTWWQISLLKWAVLFIGITIGATWPEVFSRYVVALLTIGLILSCYLGVVWFRGK